MTGNPILDFRFWILDWFRGGSPSQCSDARSIPNPQSAIRNQKGFSLLELMIAMFIMIILLSVAVPTYQRSVRHARETVLRENLWQIRRSIDQYTADKGRLPQSMEDIVEAKYLHEMPMDPIQNAAEWDEIMGEDTLSPEGEQGLVNVKTLAEGQDSEGVSYKDY